MRPHVFAFLTMSSGVPSTVTVWVLFSPSLYVHKPIDLSKFRYCPVNLSKCTVRSGNISMCLKDLDLTALSSTYADMPASLGGILCKIALAMQLLVR